MIDSATLPAAIDAVPVRDRFRIRFAKTGLLRWIGHHDLQRLWERLLRRNGLPLAISNGFHPRPRISFASALALGIEGLDEVVEIELTQSISAEALRSLIAADNQPGLSVGEVTLIATNGGNGGGSDVSPGLKKARHHSSEYEIEIPDEYDVSRVDDALRHVQTLETLSIQRKEKTVTVSTGRVFPSIKRRERLICVTQIEIDGASLKITDLLDAMGLADLLAAGGIIRRTRLYLTDQLTSAGLND
ncbi:MAG: TIGR03936 family radical SAM-associated protein [Planctomycetaceae bacterium]